MLVTGHCEGFPDGGTGFARGNSQQKLGDCFVGQEPNLAMTRRIVQMLLLHHYLE